MKVAWNGSIKKGNLLEMDQLERESYKKRNQLEKESGKKWINFKGKIVRKGSIRKGKLHEMDQLKIKSCKKRINANLQLGCHGNTAVCSKWWPWLLIGLRECLSKIQWTPPSLINVIK